MTTYVKLPPPHRKIICYKVFKSLLMTGKCDAFNYKHEMLPAFLNFLKALGGAWSFRASN